MAKNINPFYFGNEVFDDDFCNRTEELLTLKDDAVSGQNVLIYAPRRFGKTSLLKKLQQELDKDNDYKIIYMDLFSISTVDEFIQKYFDIIASSLESTTDKIINLFKTILKIKPNINITIADNGEVSYGLSLNKKEQNQTLEDVLNLPFIYAKKFNKKVVVIFDEFQEIEQFGLEKKLRSAIQSHARDVSYLFSGSKKSMLTQMFNDKNRAFYKSVKHFRINRILLNDWIDFISDKFKQTDKKITTKQIEKVYEITGGFPYYMQQIMSVVWSSTTKSADDKIISDSLKLMLEREYDLYSFIWTNLTPNQKNSLKHIIHNNGLNLYSNENLRESNISATTLKSTLEALIKKDICDKSNDKYYLIDPFMKYWLENI